MQISYEAACHCIFKKLPQSSCQKRRIFVWFAIVKALFVAASGAQQRPTLRKSKVLLFQLKILT